MHKSYLIAKYHERWGLGTYLGFLSGNDTNCGILIVAIHGSSGNSYGHFSIPGKQKPVND